MADFIKTLTNPPIDGAIKQELQELIKAVLGTFTTNYVKYYALGLVKKAMDDAAAVPGPEWKLQQRPPREAAFKEGNVIKEGGFFTRKMNKRYFVVRPDYLIDYYADEEAKNKGKKRGTISLCGYSVNPDANQGTIQRLFKLAEKMGVDTSSLPKPKEYPPNTMEVYHPTRETLYLHLEDPEEFKQWLSQIRDCVWRARGFKNSDPVHIWAFNKAIWATRCKLGRWGWWGYGGTEEQILADLIANEIEWTIMGKVYYRITGAWAVRYAVRNQVVKTVTKMVLAAVTPAWNAMDKTVSDLRPKIEPKIKEVVDPIGKLKAELLTKIKDACLSAITPILDENVNPHLAKILVAIQSPVVEAFDESFKIFDKEIDLFEAKETVEENKKEFPRHLDWYSWTWKMWDATNKVDVMYEPLWALNLVFPDIYPWGLIWDAHETLRRFQDNAVYTFEQNLIEAQEKGEKDVKSLCHKIKHSVLEDYKVDADQMRNIYFTDLMMKVVMPPFEKLVYPAAAALLEPISSAIPEPMQQFFDINDMFQQVIEGVVKGSISNALAKA